MIEIILALKIKLYKYIEITCTCFTVYNNTLLENFRFVIELWSKPKFTVSYLFVTVIFLYISVSYLMLLLLVTFRGNFICVLAKLLIL